MMMQELLNFEKILSLKNQYIKNQVFFAEIEFHKQVHILYKIRLQTLHNLCFTAQATAS